MFPGIPEKSVESEFKARFLAHYVDNDFECCGSITI